MNVFAANDQENLAHKLQAAAASKPLNAGLKGYSAKTPGNKAPKTPFKVPLNDENAVTKAGKSALKINGKGNGNLLLTAKKDGKVDNSAFVTPAGPRTRAPLGLKTTNAKAKAVQTPVPQSASAKTQKASPRLRRPKVKVHQPEVEDEEEDDVPEVEYMPPKEVPLPDDMDDYLPRDWKFPMFEGKNATRGIWDAYHNPIEDDGRTRLQREFEEEIELDSKKRNEEFDKLFAAQWEGEMAQVDCNLGFKSPKKPEVKPTVKPGDPKKKIPGPSTMKVKSAVAALSDIPRPHFAASTAATRSRIPAGLDPSKKTVKTSANSSTARHTAAAVASKSTIGYAQGRATTMNAKPRQPLSNVTKPAPFGTVTGRPITSASSHSCNASTTSAARNPRGEFSRSNSLSTNAAIVPSAKAEQPRSKNDDLDRDLQLLLLLEEDGQEADMWADSFASQLDRSDPFDEDLEDFQLQLPEGL